MINQRQEKLITMMSESKPWITGRELACLFQVSDRTIRSDIECINRHFHTSLILSDQHRGYQIDRNQLREIRQDDTNKIPQTPEERSHYILQDLLFQKNDISLGNLQDEVFVSEYSLEQDLKRIRKLIELYGDLRLVRIKNFIHLEGSENNKRKLYKYLLEKEAKGNFLNMNKLATLYKEFDFLEVKQLLDDTIEEYDFSIREMSMPMLMMHIGVAIERIIHHNYIQTELHKKELFACKEYEIAKAFYHRVANHIRMELIEEEIIRLALLLLGKRSSEFTKHDICIENKAYNTKQLVHGMLENLYEDFDVELREDNDLQLGLAMHLHALFQRLDQHIIIDNVYLQEIKKKYPLVFEMGVHAGTYISEQTNLAINENELGFLALHLGAAYDRSQTSDKYRVLMIYPEDQSAGKLCAIKVEQRFAQRMTIIDHHSVFEEEQVEALHPDLILTTLPLMHHLNVMTEQISLFVNYEDESRIFVALSLLDKQKNKVAFQEMIEAMILPEFFYYDYDASTPIALIDFMCDALQTKQMIPKTFKQSVLQREQMSSTSFVFGFAVPHALNVAAYHSCLSIAILKHPIAWGEFDVQLVILLGIKEDDKKLMQIFFDWLSNVVSNSNQFATILQAKNHEELIKQILQN